MCYKIYILFLLLSLGLNAQQTPYEHLQEGEEAYHIFFDGDLAIESFKFAIKGYAATDSLERQVYAEYMLARSHAYLLNDFKTTEKGLKDFIDQYQSNQDSSIQRWYLRAMVSLGTSYGERNMLPEKEILLYEQALGKQLKLLGENHKDIANTYNEMHFHYKYQGNVEREVFYAKKSLSILEDLWKTPANQDDELKSALADGYTNYAAALGASSTFNKLEAYQKAVALSETIYPDNHPALAVMYANLASSYDETGDIALAAGIMEKAMAVAEKKLALTKPDYYAQFCVSYAKYQEKLGNNEQASLFYEQARSLIQQNLQETPLTISTFVIRESSHFLINQGDFEKATDQLKAALKWMPKNTIHAADLWNQLALAASEQGHFKMARSLLEKARKNVDAATKSSNSSLHTITFKSLAELSLKEKDYVAALNYASLAIHSELTHWENTDSLAPPTLSALFNDINLLKSIHSKAEALFHIGKQKGHKNELIASLEHIALLDNFALDLKKEAITAFAEQFLIEEMADVYRLGTEVALYANNTDLALKYAEKSRGGLLEEALTNRNNKQNNNELDSLWNIEMQLREKIVQLDHKEGEARAKSKEKSEVILALQALHQQNPHYTVLFKEQLANLDREEIQSQLKEGQVYIEYLFTKTHLLAFCLNKEQFFIKKIPSDKLEEKVLNLYKNISDPSSGDRWKAEAHHLYTEILAPVFIEFAQEPEQLIIIPDQYLHYLPFEVLLAKKEGRFLIENMPISYAYGFRFLNEKGSIKKAPKKLLSVAPLYTSPPDTTKILAELVRSGYFPLKGAQDEAKAISHLYNGDLLLGAGATKTAFLNQAKDYQILHLAMHALLNDDKPSHSSLIFAQEKGRYSLLYNYELYRQNFAADLVVLSACNTANGQYLDGEGLIGLSKGFAFAGIKSTLTSLWKVPDQETRLIMEGFYTALKGGRLKNEALRDAKLQYLSQIKQPQLRHPYYWSGFILMGDTSAVSAQNIFSFWLFGGLVILLFGLWWLIKRQNKG